jgi:hypothetical protein
MSIAIDEMIEPVERFFEREFPAERSLFTGLEEDVQHDPYAQADLAYVQGAKDALHAVCVARSYADSLTDVHGGIHASSGLDANFCWLAMPLHEFRDGDDMCNGLLESLCEERGIGLITVQPSGLGFSAKVIVEPKRRKGRFLKSYEGLPSMWKHNT